ncbi:DUF4493 domain-containing protein [uncultured Parabacteroides sp.]|uniref:DUF4493 domain-containing protein n=1 Tax=uncultured Parabacteroides sp. TaxID=512312 RepID=UPI002614E51E|nr:DUF4493 domain-containing protein [uncultured Parabacteroides sp.]
MRKKIFTSWGMACLLGCCLMLSSCSSEGDELDIPEGKGFVKIDLTPEVGFQTKAVDENEYKEVNNYTVQVFKAGQEEKLIINDLYKNLEEVYQLNVGNYMLKAFMGEDKPVSSEVLYFSGEAAFEVKEGEEVTAPVTCKPSSARINVVFDSKMDEYFSAYSLKIETEAQKPSSFEWTKDIVGPMYFKVGNQEDVKVTVSLTPKENVTAKDAVKTYTLSPADALKLTLKPVISNGNLGISITVDETTVDHPVDIVIPGDWV